MRFVRAFLGAAVFSLLLSGLPPAARAEDPVSGPVLTRVRFFPRDGQASRMVKGRFSGSNTSATNDFVTLHEIREAPPEGQWSEVSVRNDAVYRFVKYEAPNGSWGNVAEVEFYGGDRKLAGTPFGTVGSRDNKGNDFRKALDGDPATFFDGVGPNGQYVGIDLGPEVQAAAPVLSVESGAYPGPVRLRMTTATPGATITYTTNGQAPRRDPGTLYADEVVLGASAIVMAVARKPGLADSVAVIAAYRIGGTARDAKSLRTYHIGNSLTDTVDGWVKPVAESAGYRLDFHRFTIPGAPTDWLWDHPGTGFGDSRYAEAFLVLAPIDHLFTQPFAGHDRSIENESDYSGRFFDLCRKHSPDVQPWLYVQWPARGFGDSWCKGKGAVSKLGLRPAATWQEGVANHAAYTEAVRKAMEGRPGKPVRIVPGGVALATLKTEIDAGRVPGMTDFFAETFSDDIHLSPKGRYLVSLVHYACLFRESPEGKVAALSTGLTPGQLAVFQKLAWESVKDYPWAGVAPGPN
jgi:hypothetical protein